MSEQVNVENLGEIIGNNLKKIRRERGLSLDQVSELTGVSKSMLGQIERGESSASVATLWKISNGLKVSFTTMMAAGRTSAEIIYNYAKKPIMNENELFRIYTIFPFEPERNFEILHIEIEPGGISKSQPHESGTEEFILVYEGELILHKEDRQYKIGPMHSIRFQADCFHAYENSENELCRYCMVIYYSH